MGVYYYKHCCSIHSDNGTNFVGAERELREEIKELPGRETEKWLEKEEIEWHFQPRRAPYFGGSHESLVKIDQKDPLQNAKFFSSPNMTRFTLELLSKDNYDSWRLQMEALFVKMDAWPYVEGAILKPEPELNASNALDIKAWNLADRKAYSDTILSISLSELRQVKDCSTSRELWRKLEVK